MPPHYMTILASLPSPNGHIDQEFLPEILTSNLQKEDARSALNTELKETIATIWQQLIYTDRSGSSDNDAKLNRSKQLPLITNQTISSTHALSPDFSQSDTKTLSPISAASNFYSLGGDSLLLTQMYRHYQSLFHFDTESVTIRPFFECNTIDEHARLLEAIITDDIQSRQWCTLHINQGKGFLNLFL
jgi:hypothetical protein